jgi:hypothetical protein
LHTGTEKKSGTSNKEPTVPSINDDDTSSESTSSNSDPDSDSDSDSDADEDKEEDQVMEHVAPEPVVEKEQETSGKSKEDKKKSKKSKDAKTLIEEPKYEMNGTEDKKDKKSDKKRKREEVVNEDASAVETAKVKKKKSKKQSAEELAPSAMPGSESAIDGGEQWNVQALEGGDKRKEKFLKLLGAKKSGGTGGDPAGSARPNTDVVQMQRDLERQFEAGMKMKNENQGHRKGLGA